VPGSNSALRRLQGFWTFIYALVSQPQSAAGALIVLFFAGLAIAGPAIAPYDDNDQSHPVAQAPGPGYPFGTDYLGRDVFSRVILGARSIVLTAGAGTLIAVVLGALLGLCIGYYGGIIDELAGRIIDTLLALPALLIALIAVGIIRSLDLPPDSLRAAVADRSVLFVIAIVYVPIVARVVRSSTLSVKNSEFIWAAQIRGESPAYIMLQEILPSVIPALAVEASLRFAYAIFLVASLGFLGVGARPPSPDWGLMVNENRSWYSVAPWALNYPAAAIAVLVVGVNFMADGVRRLLLRGS
jgi:peptide/nickel transport system permease protein